jgi:transcriptional regulator with XRE-family HTH domain
MTIGENIKWARQQAALSPYDLSLRIAPGNCYMTPERIIAYESGIVTPRFSELVRIADALKRPVDFFLSPDEPPKEEFHHCRPYAR